jgi:anti-sigma factor RsiW
MTCGDVAQLLDAFVDAELPAPMLLAVARHAGACPSCDIAVRELTELREVVERSSQEDAAALDLSGIWPAVSEGIDRIDARRAWMRRLRSAPAWGLALAAAASAVIWFRTPADEPARVAARRPNQAVIERIDSDSARFELRSERKLGTTLIMVSADGDEVGR